VHGLTAEDPFPWLDQSGLAALLAGSFVVLIKFFTTYSHVDFPANASIAVTQKIGIPLFFAALAAFVGEVKLVSNAQDQKRVDTFAWIEHLVPVRCILMSGLI